MVSLPATRRSYASLSFTNGEVVVTPKDRDIFLISAEKAIEACKSVVQQGKRVRRFESDFLMPLHEWCVTHSDQVKACYIPVAISPCVKVFVLTKSPQYDLNFGEHVAQLELKLSANWRVGVSQLPDADDSSLATFFNPEGALEVYANQGSTSQEGRKQP